MGVLLCCCCCCCYSRKRGERAAVIKAKGEPVTAEQVEARTLTGAGSISHVPDLPLVPTYEETMRQSDTGAGLQGLPYSGAEAATSMSRRASI